MSTDEPPADARPTDDNPDVRVYVIDPELWEARVKQDSERMHCYQQNPGEDYFHLIAKGEVYVVGGTEKLCLRCALRRGGRSHRRASEVPPRRRPRTMARASTPAFAAPASRARGGFRP